MDLNTMLIISFLIISILGTVLHFTHNWFKNGILLHIFSAINESTWEHMKLLVLPTILVGLLQYILFSDIYPNLFNSLLVLSLVELLSIPFLYEPLRLTRKKVPLFINILIFYAAILLGLSAQYFILKNGTYFLNENISLICILVLTILFGIFTYAPPKMFLFKDPVTKKYGDSENHI